MWHHHHRHQISKEGLDEVNGSPYFPIPEGGLSCKLRITAALVSAAALGALCQRPAAAYYETASAVRHTAAFASSPDASGSPHVRRMTTGAQVICRHRHSTLTLASPHLDLARRVRVAVCRNLACLHAPTRLCEEGAASRTLNTRRVWHWHRLGGLHIGS